MARPNSVEKTFMGGYKTMKFVNFFSLESFVLYGSSLTTTVLLPMALRSYGTSHSETDQNKKNVPSSIIMLLKISCAKNGSQFWGFSRR